jgi:hypothetical protein
MTSSSPRLLAEIHGDIVVVPLSRYASILHHPSAAPFRSIIETVPVGYIGYDGGSAQEARKIDDSRKKKSSRIETDADLILQVQSGRLTPRQERRIVRKFAERNRAFSTAVAYTSQGTQVRNDSGDRYRAYVTRSMIFLGLMAQPVVVGFVFIGDVEMSDFDSRQWTAFGALVATAVPFGILSLICAYSARRILFSNMTAWMKQK